MSCRTCTVQIQPRKPVLDRADYTAITRPHDLDHAYEYQERICPAWQILIVKRSAVVLYWGSMICPRCQVLCLLKRGWMRL